MGSVESLPTPKPAFAAPRPITVEDRLDAFGSGRPPLDDFLRKRAVKNEGHGSRTYVVCSTLGEEAGNVVAFYSLSAGAVRHDEAPTKLKRNMPNPLPVFVLGRMAVDERYQGKGLGKGMLKDAMQRALEASRAIGVRALLVHAIDDEAVTFYTQFGFQEFPIGTRTLFLPIETIANAL